MMNVNKVHGNFVKYGVMRDVFNPEEIEKILFLEKLLDFRKGEVGNGTVTTHRDSNIAWLQPDENARWIFDKISFITSKVNYDLFMYDINRIPAVQYTKYDSLMEQHYDWHVDEYSHYNDYQRKVSGVIILTGPDEYEGGELEVIHNGNPEQSVKLKPNAGEVVFFASHMPHKVHPVTSGIRKSIVFWAEGPWG
jgi:PKHD-type hydroxylase